MRRQNSWTPKNDNGENAKMQKSVSVPLIARSNRKIWIDGLRALAMLFVIFGHQVYEFPNFIPYFVFTSPIKIPLFFMITGYVFNDTHGPKHFFKNLLLKLIIPWLCLTIPYMIVKIPAQGINNFIHGLYTLISGEIVWYMPCCIIAEIIWFFIRKYLRKISFTCFGTILMFALGAIFSYFDIFNFAMINRAMLMQLFILSGYLYRLYEKRFMRTSWCLIISLLVIYVAMGYISLIIWPSACLDVHMNNYYNWPYCFTMMILGCFTAFIFANKIGKAPRVLSFIGQNTLVFYLLHSNNIRVGVRFLSMLKIDLPDSLWGAITKTLIACIGCALEAVLLNRFFPVVVGKKN